MIKSVSRYLICISVCREFLKVWNMFFSSSYLSLMICANLQYACRKTLADSRPRVRGRFAKNDDFGDIHRTVCGHHEDDEYEEVRFLILFFHLQRKTFC